MMVRFFTHADGSGRAAVEYLLAEEVAAYTEDRKRIAGQTIRRDVLPEVLSGDPDEAGIYVFRLKIPPGLTFPPHHHDQDRYVTVISGVWAFGTGYSGKCEDTIPLTAGAYVVHPKGAVHFDGACGEEAVEVQIIGRGPVKTTWVEEAE